MKKELFVFLTVLLAVVILIAGCAPQNLIKDIEVRRIPLIDTATIFEDQPYTETETKITGQKCIEKEYTPQITDATEFLLSHDAKEWVTEPGVLGETNQLRRVAHIYNGLNVIKTVYVDKVYFYNGTETKRSTNPMKFLIDPKQTRDLFVMWDTQYDPLKDVKLDLTNTTSKVETNIIRICYNETEKVDVTKYKKINAGESETIVGYSEIERVNLNTA